MRREIWVAGGGKGRGGEGGGEAGGGERKQRGRGNNYESRVYTILDFCFNFITVIDPSVYIKGKCQVILYA